MVLQKNSLYKVWPELHPQKISDFLEIDVSGSFVYSYLVQVYIWQSYFWTDLFSETKQTIFVSTSRYLYSGMIPSPSHDGTMLSIFSFLCASHTETDFKTCLQFFFNKVMDFQKQHGLYRKFKSTPFQVITDMSLVVFRGSLGKKM
jgi:hypothetical protein